MGKNKTLSDKHVDVAGDLSTLQDITLADVDLDKYVLLCSFERLISDLGIFTLVPFST